MTEFRWLIEGPGPHYLGVRELVGRYGFHWTTDHDAALQFCSQAQADMTMMAVRHQCPDLFAFEPMLSNARATEHGWMEPRHD